MTIVVHANDWRAIQCNPIAQQSAKIVAIRPTQRNTIARLVSAAVTVNYCVSPEQKRRCLHRDIRSSRHERFEAIVARFLPGNLLWLRSEERRVGKECRFWWSAYHERKKREY